MPNEWLNEVERKYADKLDGLIQESSLDSREVSLAKLLNHIIGRFYSIASEKGENKQFGQIVLGYIFPTWTRLLNSQLQIENEHGRELSLRNHCYLLSTAIYFIGYEGHLPRKWNQRDGAFVSWEDASEWLEVAASVERVEVDTSYFDDSTQLCGTAYDYQMARSLKLSHLVQQLAIFNFVWGSLETAIKLIDPPKVPKHIKPGGTSDIDRALYYLKTKYEPRSPVVFYRETVSALDAALRAEELELVEDFRLEDHMSLPGLGLSIVRKIRNKFAHGAARMPEHSEDSDNSELATKVIELSTRVLLYALQSLLVAYLSKTNFEVEIRHDQNGEPLNENIHFLLRSLHVEQKGFDEAQLFLFDPMIIESA